MIGENSISLNKLPFKLDLFIGDLFYHEVPVTSIYDEDGIPLIIEWVDSNNEENTEIYYAYKVDKGILKKYLSCKITHWDLIKSAIGGIGFLYKEDEECKISSVSTLSPICLPINYRPSSKSFFVEDYAVDHKKIELHFSLNEIENLMIEENIKEVSKVSNSEIINLHLKKGNGIGLGTVNTKLLGSTLLKFDKFYREVALDSILGNTRGSIPESKTTQEHQLVTSTEIVLSLAASYSVFIRPLVSQTIMFEETTKSALIALKINEIFSKTSNEEEILSLYNSMSDYVFKSYKSFLTEIVKNEIDIDVKWFNPNNQDSYNKSFSLVNTNNIINSINNINTSTYKDFITKGKFNRLHIDTGFFSFISNNGEVYTGYFDKLIKDSMATRDFITMYEIKINQSTNKEAGKVAPTVDNTIISCLEYNES